ncbi:putative transposase, partial [Acinetobacter baumannii 99063]
MRFYVKQPLFSPRRSSTAHTNNGGFIHNNKELYGVEAICRILPIAPSTYYRTLDLCENPEHRAKRDLHDLHHAEEIKRIWKESSGRYGVR